MKALIILPALALIVGCSDTSEPCMGPVEKGKVIRAMTDTRQICGRGGCSTYNYTFVNIEVNGVSRTCVVPETTAKMFGVGEVINVRTGRRI